MSSHIKITRDESPPQVFVVVVDTHVVKRSWVQLVCIHELTSKNGQVFVAGTHTPGLLQQYTYKRVLTTVSFYSPTSTISHTTLMTDTPTQKSSEAKVQRNHCVWYLLAYLGRVWDERFHEELLQHGWICSQLHRGRNGIGTVC